MFHRHETHSYQPQYVPLSTGGHWYVTDAQYHEAIRRGMQLRSEIAADLVKGLGRRIGRLFKT